MMMEQATKQAATEAAAAEAGFRHIRARKDHGHNGHQAQDESSRKHCEPLTLFREFPA